MRKKIFGLIFLLLLGACSPRDVTLETAEPSPLAATPSASAAAQATAAPTATPHTLTICLDREPETLFPLQATSRAAQTVLSLVYDGPLERVGFSWQPTIFERLPSVASGDVTIEAVQVQVGDEVLNADGLPATLDDGVQVLPMGCQQAACAVTFERGGVVTMPQMQVVFHLKPNLRWADGEPLTAEDAVFAWHLAQSLQLPQDWYLLDRTADFRALDAQTLVWTGKPGFLDSDYADNFWQPLPAHAWSASAPAELPDAEMSARLPLGWGPYVLDSWISGESIHLKRNPIYAGAAPFFDEVTFRFTPDSETAVADLLSGACDVIAPAVPLGEQIGILHELEAKGQVRVWAASDMTMEVLAMGIQPAAYDDGYQPGIFGDRPDYFGDVRTRQALAYCLDRQRVVDEVLDGLTYVPDSFVPRGHPLFDPTTPVYAYDPEAGKALLEEAGWKDLDGDPSTPLTAWSVVGVQQGTPLVLQYWTTDAAHRRAAARIFSDSLAACGIQLETHFLPPETLFADAPEGVLFGRQFELAQYAMGVLSGPPPCYWYLSEEIPSPDNTWLGTNLSGYSNPTYDAVCRQAMRAIPDDDDYLLSWHRAAQIFAHDLPVIPLYARLGIAATRPDLCGVSFPDGTNRFTWNIEAWYLSSECEHLP